MAYAPLVGQVGGSYGFDLPDEASEMFFAAGLDGWNRDEIAGEISLRARPPSPRLRRGKPGYDGVGSMSAAFFPLPVWERVA